MPPAVGRVMPSAWPRRGEDGMSAKAIVPGALILAVLGGWSARGAEPPALRPVLQTAQQPAPPSDSPVPEVLPNPKTPPVDAPTTPAGPTAAGLPPGPNGLPPGSYVDPWIHYTRPGCCGPLGA